MTNGLPERDDERFEEVLERLDALVRRGQPDSDPPPPPPAVSEASIPVLTEVYRPEWVGAAPQQSAPEQPVAPGLSAEEKLEQAVVAVLPVMTEVLETVLAQAVQPALERAIADLRPQMEAALRQRLQQALAQEQDQTEM